MESKGRDGDGSTFYFTMKADAATSTPPPCSLTAYSLSLLTPLTAVVIVDKTEVSRKVTIIIINNITISLFLLTY